MSEKLNITRVSELIKIEDINKWNNGETITISAGTGVGKSYFIKNILYAFAEKENKKILFLIHRTNCVNQFKEEIKRDNKTDIIDIKTYQKLEHDELKKYENNLNNYAFIVCDEFHYFLSDASFSKTTDMSLSLILKQTESIKIFMSATGDYMRNYIHNVKDIKTIDYELPIDFKFIEQLTFFAKDETLEKFIEKAIEKNYKSIFFIQGSTQAYDLYKKFKKKCLFNCGKGDKHYKYVNKDKINNMLINEKFDELILITTTCMDAGVNIVDTEVKHIICVVDDVGTLIQCIGRKRIQNNDDKFKLYVKSKSNQQLGGKETQIKKKLVKADFLKDHTVKEYIEKYPKETDYSNIVYDNVVEENNKSTKVINELMYYKNHLDICDIEFMKMYGAYGYCKYLANILGFRNEDGYYTYRLIEENWREKDMEKYLDSIVSKRLLNDEKKELIDKIGLKDARGRIQKSITLINAYLEENKLLYIILSKTTKDKNRKSIRFWEVNKLTD